MDKNQGPTLDAKAACPLRTLRGLCIDGPLRNQFGLIEVPVQRTDDQLLEVGAGQFALPRHAPQQAVVYLPHNVAGLGEGGGLFPGYRAVAGTTDAIRLTSAPDCIRAARDLTFRPYPRLRPGRGRRLGKPA